MSAKCFYSNVTTAFNMVIYSFIYLQEVIRKDIGYHSECIR